MAKQNIICCDEEEIDIGEFNDSSESTSIVDIKTEILGKRYSIFIDGPIGDASEFRDVYSILTNATELDEIKFIGNSAGGYLHSFIPLYNLIRQTPANTVADLYQAYSTAGLLMLSCKTIIVNDFSSIMVHSPSKSEFGKLEDLESAIAHLKILTQEIYDKVYRGFLSQQEMDEVMLGKELYITGKENLIKRITNMRKIQSVKNFTFFKKR